MTISPQTAAIGVDDALLGQSIQAFVLRRENDAVTEDELRQYCAARMPPYMLPKRVVFVEQMPLTTSGKIDYAQLRSLAASRPTASRTPGS